MDAIEFALTGNMSRLTGRGTSGVSIARHGPHVERRDDPSGSAVELVLELLGTSETVTLSRGLSDSADLEISPDTPEIRAALAEVALHPEMVLSRREIIKFVVAEPGVRSKEIQALLRLDKVGSTRSTLKTVQNRTATLARQALKTHSDAVEDLCRHLDIPEFAADDLRAQVNSHRAVLGLPGLSAVDDQTSLSQGVIFSSDADSFNKTSALRDLDSFESLVASQFVTNKSADSISRVCNKLSEAPDLQALLAVRPFLEKGLSLVDSAECPLCDKLWTSLAELEEHLREKISASEAAQVLQKELDGAVEGLIAEGRAASARIRRAGRIATQVGCNAIAEQLETWAAEVVQFVEGLKTLEGATSSSARIAAGWLGAPGDIERAAEDLRAQVEARPDQSEKAASHSFLSIAEERWVKLNRAQNQSHAASKTRAAAALAYRSYCEESESVLDGLYQQVEQTFTDYYRQINSDDESDFKAKFAPSEEKLDLSVDFYGRGMFPPSAYHSEGHQDGMGVCLYLALMKQLLGTRFQFALLDDVVMSVDAGHRKQFCELLKSEFPSTQFIITTHDKAWARQMRYQGLVSTKTTAQFHGWSVETGPIYEQETDAWAKIAEDVTADDIPAAAARLRRHLEYVCAELAEEFGAKVPYRVDGDHDLGELLSAIVGKYGDLVKKIKKSATSWGNAAAQAQADALDERRKSVLAQESMERWTLNKAVHYNEWAEFERADFEPVVEALKDLLELFRCASCKEWLSLSGPKFKPDALRCPCSAVNYNLTIK